MNWYEIKAKANRKAEVWIYDTIGGGFWSEGTTAKKFCKEVSELDVDDLDVHINSPGGSVFDGQAIHTILKNHSANVTTYIDGLAASIASIIALAGRKVVMAQGGMFMIHNPRGVSMGESKDMRKTADVLDKIHDVMRGIYVGKCGKDDDEVSKAMDAETWYTADEAMEMGFVDEIGCEMKVAACAIPDDIMAQYKNPPDCLSRIMKGGETMATTDEKSNHGIFAEIRDYLQNAVEKMNGVAPEAEDDAEDITKGSDPVVDKDELTQIEELTAQVEDLTDQIETMKAETEVEQVDVWAGIPETIRQQFEEEVALREKAEQEATDAKEANIAKDFEAKASELEHIGKTEDVAKILRSAYDSSDEDGESLEQMLKALNARVEAGDLFTEIGRSGGGEDAENVEAKIEAEVKKAQKEDETYHQAYARFLDTPEGRKLHEAHESEVK